MIQVITARSAGFCFGVERAVQMAADAAGSGRGPVYTLGPIVHNESVLKELEEKGVRIVSEEDLDTLGSGILIIRAHGVSRAVTEQLKTLPLEIRDATCPFVKKIHQIAAEHTALGEHVIIAGDPAHPEVRGHHGLVQRQCFGIERTGRCQFFHISCRIEGLHRFSDHI